MIRMLIFRCLLTQHLPINQSQIVTGNTSVKLYVYTDLIPVLKFMCVCVQILNVLMNEKHYPVSIFNVNVTCYMGKPV